MGNQLSMCSLRVWLAGVVLTCSMQAHSQVLVQSVQVDGAAPVEFMFSDLGTGATNYAVEFQHDLGTGTWERETNATISATGPGSYSVQVNSPRVARGFYRVVGLGGTNGPIIVEFSSVTLRAIEGDTAFPTLLLSQAFNGIVKYTVSGTAMSGDYLELSGQVSVNGKSVVIPVSLTDDNEIGRMKYLTLRLETDAGYQLGGASTVTINIEENDSEWQGRFQTDDAALGFLLRIRESNGVHTATLRGDETGFFPANEVPATVTFSTDNFAAAVLQVPIPGDATLLNEPMHVTLQLNAMNGTAGQSVTPDLVSGVGTLVAIVPDQPHLNTTNAGTFSLLRPPVSPSTNEVKLVTTP